MELIRNKPRVFLSHSKKDAEFIEKLANDLRKCQIDPWLDTYEIRQGKSWMEEIFQLGMPTCDAILIYFTNNSISSTVVKKEIDAGLLQQLADNKIAFLPYVSDSTLRTSLRPDIQVLQTLEWNESNYSEILPRVVAEIWRSFLDRTVVSAIKEEKLKRIQAELELEKNKNQREEFFTLAENFEFQYLLDTLSRDVSFTFSILTSQISKKPKEEVLSKAIQSNYLHCLLDFLDNEFYDMNPTHFQSYFKEHIMKKFPEFFTDRIQYIIEFFNDFPDIPTELITIDFLEINSHPNLTTQRPFSSITYEYVLTKKYRRFRYWLKFNNKDNFNVSLQYLEINHE